ncbi:MAG: P-II family nitrogen regulator [Candidatus Omnitrophica bacterium]|nr:P-II family nitrogen regulator [Candidatus Omnitrophota bacterium]
MDSGISLIVTIVAKGWGDTVLDASIDAGANGGTILLGRGRGIHERQKILGIDIEPEKEIVFTLTYKNNDEEILKKITQECKLDKPGKGIAFIIPVEKVAGASHILGESKGGKDG